ncbi:hypothetical protein FUAX_52000 (plasmid) [Fulvitalea axinellae]|uniref:Metal-dependent hydrolase, endonuclease/exonuclease/phosphatase family n=1 Tax=Fulvitalea axinellae TaxID=1182444 RepID=A0AAU9CXU4_9BACT|nr:hypothetical protein FUAX_52000 [Fulvitalea axinellae]
MDKIKRLAQRWGLACLGLLILGLSGCAEKKPDEPLKVMSFNIRNGRANDGDNVWKNRVPLVYRLFDEQNPDIAGLQEAYEDQLFDILKEEDDYAFCGVGREDGKKKGEYAPIIYKKKRFRLLETGNFWLSESPEIPGSMGWDAAVCRIATWGRFKDKVSGHRFLFVNTHFDHKGHKAQEESAKLLLARTKVLAGEDPVIVTGDFNFEPKDSPYAILTGQWQGLQKLSDSRVIAKESQPYDYTYQAYGKDKLLIDHILVNDRVWLDKHYTVRLTEGNLYVSDHFPVFSKIRFGKTPEAVAGNVGEMLPTKVFAPYTKEDRIVFGKKMNMELFCATEGAEIRYTTDGTEPNAQSALYTQPVKLEQSADVKAKAFKKGSEESRTLKVGYYKAKSGATAKLTPETDPDPRFEKNISLLLDRKTAPSLDYPDWAGFGKKGMLVRLDWKEARDVKRVTVRFLSDEGSWILPPNQFKLYSSKTKQGHKAFAYKRLPDTKASQGKSVTEISVDCDVKDIRSLKIEALPAPLPDDHSGAGKPAWIFADEIIVE